MTVSPLAEQKAGAGEGLPSTVLYGHRLPAIQTVLKAENLGGSVVTKILPKINSW